MDAAFVHENPKDVLAAWYVYAGNRAALWPARIRKSNADVEDDFEVETLTRGLLAQHWRSERSKGVAADASLDLMEAVEREGLMNEYVLVSFARPGWTIPSLALAKLDLPRYRAYADAHLRDHRPVRPVRFFPADGPASPAIPGATLPPLESLDPQRTPCAANRAVIADALARWAAEEAELHGAPLAAANRAGFVRALEKVRTAAPFASRGATWVAPNVTDLHQIAGFCAVDEGRWADAVKVLAKAAALDPFHSVARGELALVYTHLRRLDDAERVAADALLVASNDCERARCLRQQGYVLIERGRLLEALQTYHRSLELGPSNKTAEHEIQVILSELRRVGGASAKAAADYRPPPASADINVTGCPR